MHGRVSNSTESTSHRHNSFRPERVALPEVPLHCRVEAWQPVKLSAVGWRRYSLQCGTEDTAIR